MKKIYALLAALVMIVALFGVSPAVADHKPNHGDKDKGTVKCTPNDPDGDSNGGKDCPDGNNGSGNDADCEDDNKGKGVPGHCKDKDPKPDPKPTDKPSTGNPPVKNPPVDDCGNSDCGDHDAPEGHSVETNCDATKCEKVTYDSSGNVIDRQVELFPVDIKEEGL